MARPKLTLDKITPEHLLAAANAANDILDWDISTVVLPGPDSQCADIFSTIGKNGFRHVLSFHVMFMDTDGIDKPCDRVQVILGLYESDMAEFPTAEFFDAAAMIDLIRKLGYRI